MKILLLSRYSHLGASSRLRSYQYLPYLKAYDIDVTVSSLLSDDYLRKFYSGSANQLTERISSYFQRFIQLFKSTRFDLLWIEKELFPWLPSWCEMLIVRLGIPYIVDYDDAIFHKYDTHSNILVRKLLGNKIDAVMRNAVAVTAGNKYLMARAKKAGARRVEYLPTVIDLERYFVKDTVEKPIFTIGWIGSPTTAKYLEMIRPVLSQWDKKNNARFVIIGADSFKIDGIRVEHRPWSQDSEVLEIQKFDIGIMPLPDNLWEKGKCGYKLIQYMACGKSVIASPVGVNSEIVEHGTNGFLARSGIEWLKALGILYADHELRHEMGKAGREKVESAYCIQATVRRFANLLYSIAPK